MSLITDQLLSLRLQHMVTRSQMVDRGADRIRITDWAKPGSLLVVDLDALRPPGLDADELPGGVEILMHPDDLARIGDALPHDVRPQRATLTSIYGLPIVREPSRPERRRRAAMLLHFAMRRGLVSRGDVRIHTRDRGAGGLELVLEVPELLRNAATVRANLRGYETRHALGLMDRATSSAVELNRKLLAQSRWRTCIAGLELEVLERAGEPIALARAYDIAVKSLRLWTRGEPGS